MFIYTYMCILGRAQAPGLCCGQRVCTAALPSSTWQEGVIGARHKWS